MSQIVNQRFSCATLHLNHLLTGNSTLSTLQFPSVKHRLSFVLIHSFIVLIHGFKTEFISFTTSVHWPDGFQTNYIELSLNNTLTSILDFFQIHGNLISFLIKWNINLKLSQIFSSLLVYLINTLQSATGATSLLSQRVTAVNQGCSVHALGSSLVN